MGRLKKIYGVADNFGSGLSERRLTTYSAACAYYMFMSLVPMVMLVVSLLQFTPLSEELVLDAVSEYVPESLYRIVESIVQGIYSGGGVALTVSIFLTIWSAAASMKALMRGMDSVYDARRREGLFRLQLPGLRVHGHLRADAAALADCDGLRRAGAGPDNQLPAG